MLDWTIPTNPSIMCLNYQHSNFKCIVSLIVVFVCLLHEFPMSCGSDLKQLFWHCGLKVKGLLSGLIKDQNSKLLIFPHNCYPIKIEWSSHCGLDLRGVLWDWLSFWYQIWPKNFLWECQDCLRRQLGDSRQTPTSASTLEQMDVLGSTESRRGVPVIWKPETTM